MCDPPFLELVGDELFERYTFAQVVQFAEEAEAARVEGWATAARLYLDELRVSIAE